MKKKARFYLGFFICSGERVKTVFTCSRVFLSLICTNAGTRINTGFFVHSLISLSQAAQCLGTQVANAALGRRGFLRAANWKARAQCLGSQVAHAALGRRGLLRAANWKARAWVRDRTGQAAFLRDPRAGPSAQVGWRQVKVLPAFSKGRYVPVGRCPAADRGGSREAGLGRSLPVANALHRPNRQVRPASHGPKGGAGPLRPGGTLPSGRPSRQARPVGPAFPYFQKRGDVCPPLGVPPRPGVLLVEGAGRVPQRPLPGLSAAQRAPRSLHVSTGCAGLRSRPRDAVSRSASL